MKRFRYDYICLNHRNCSTMKGLGYPPCMDMRAVRHSILFGGDDFTNILRAEGMRGKVLKGKKHRHRLVLATGFVEVDE